MTRVEFTEKLARLILRMRTERENPILDFVKRTAKEENRLYEEGLSKCDGYRIKSAYQSGRAADIYFLDPEASGNITDSKHGYLYWHSVWEKMGGKPTIPWDQGRFEG